VDWSQLPAPIVKSTSIPTSPPRENVGPKKEEKPIEPSEPEVPPKTTRAEAEPAAETKQLFDVPPAPRSTLEALEQRLAKYQNSMEQAQAENNSSKVRRMGRIVKQYQDAIKTHKAGKAVPFDELPTPPGFPPIPGAPLKAEEDEGTGAATAAPPAATGAPAAAATSPRGPRPAPSVASPPGGAAKDVPKKTASVTRQDKELAMLLERQTMFKQAALDAKKAGELSQAKEYLRMAKGFDPLISSNKCGIPVDMSTVTNSEL
jgi:coiled-coil and C2 domain-containing protein 1